MPIRSPLHPGARIGALVATATVAGCVLVAVAVTAIGDRDGDFEVRGPDDTGSTDATTTATRRCAVGEPVSTTAVVDPPVPFPGPTGVIVGHSNAARIAAEFVPLAREHDMVWVNAASPGDDAQQWATDDALWARARARAPDATALLLIVSRSDPDPAEAEQVAAAYRHEDLPAILARARDTFPDLVVVYLQGRQTGRFSVPQGRDRLAPNAEPGAWLHGRANAAYTASLPADTWPFAVVTGPYDWDDELCARQDGFAMTRADFEADGVHPNRRGSRKIAELMVAYFDEAR